ncbi:MAG: LysM peptidoglycan-binding domain-containing protein [Cyclobacteriaceae bacterium]|nr:LysM peptidoglycan-binding domain-containing protein [Cyclobacteriaceae bacterium]
MFQIILFTLATSFSADADSLRTEMINGKPFVIHQVGEKETLYSISRRYGSTILAVLEHNPTADAGLEVGQILKVPYTPKTKSHPTVQTADGLIHKVAAKETLFSIARLYNVSVDDIKLWNNLQENSLALGQDIIIKRKPAIEVVKEVAPVLPSGARTHTVLAKETLFSISRAYGMTVQQLKDWNGIQDNELKVGQVLSVTAPTTTTSTVVTNTNPVVTTTTVVPKTTSPVTVSESLVGTDEIREIGMADLITGSEGNRKYLAQHPTVKPGTILKIRNVLTNQEVFVRVTGPIPAPDGTTIIRISKSAHDRLGALDPRFKAEITYYK